MGERRVGLQPEGANARHVRCGHGGSAHLSKFILGSAYCDFLHHVFFVISSIVVEAGFDEESWGTDVGEFSAICQLAVAGEERNVAHLVAVLVAVESILEGVIGSIGTLVGIGGIVGTYNNRLSAASNAVDGSVVGDVAAASWYFCIKDGCALQIAGNGLSFLSSDHIAEGAVAV